MGNGFSACSQLLGVIVVGLAAVMVSVRPAFAVDDVSVGSSAIVSGTVGNGLRIRSGPGMSHKIVAVIAEGTSVQVVAGPVADGEDDWYQVSAGTSATGWGLAQYLRPGGNSSSSPTPPPVAALGLGSTGLISTKITPDGRRTFVARTTAYADGVGGVPLDAKTASGTRTRWGVVAVDPKTIPLGSSMLIDGYGDTIFIAEDIGVAVRGNALDIWLPDGEEAKRYGTQPRLVTILTEGKSR